MIFCIHQSKPKHNFSWSQFVLFKRKLLKTLRNQKINIKYLERVEKVPEAPGDDGVVIQADEEGRDH